MFRAILRDTGPYSARNSSKGALITEAGRVIEGLRAGCSIGQLRTSTLDGTLLAQKARTTRERIWDALHFRYLASQPDWVLTNLHTAYHQGPQSPEFVSLLYLHYALRDHLTYDFVTEVLWNRWITQRRAVSRTDVLFLLDNAAETQPQIHQWSEQTRIKLAGSVLTALRDFGLLEGTQMKTLVKPALPLHTAEHLLRILATEDVRGSHLLRHASWRLFFCHEDDVANVLSQLAQHRRIRFERVGDTIVLETPPEWVLAL